MNPEVWLMPIQDVFDHYSTSEKGLSDTEASSRIKEYGLNELAEKERRRALEIFVSQFTNALVLVLIVAAVLSYFLKERIDAVVILSIVLLNSLLGFYQEYRAEKTVAALEKYVTYRAKVLRNGEITEIDSREVVPGDIVFMTIGDLIPADTRLIRVEGFSTEESSLTGESLPVSKSTTEVKEGLNVQDYSNMAFMGTSVVTGSAWGIVTSTGKNTFFGKTTALLLNKSLQVLAHGIIEGRKTFGNITKYILNTTSANYGNMVTVALSSLFLGFIPLLPPQILLNNFISDVPLITISTDNVDEGLLKSRENGI